MQWIAKIKFKSEILAKVNIEGTSADEVSKILYKDAAEDKLEDFEIVDISPMISVEESKSVN